MRRVSRLKVSLLLLALVVTPCTGAYADGPAGTKNFAKNDAKSTRAAVVCAGDTNPQNNVMGAPQTLGMGKDFAVTSRGNSTSDPDLMKFEVSSATIRSDARICDMDSTAGSYIRGAATAAEEWQLSVTANDPQAQVKIKVTNGWRFETKWEGLGNKLRTVSNLLSAVDVNGVEQRHVTTLTHQQALTKSTGWEVSVEGSGNLGKKDGKVEASVGITVTAKWSSTKQYGADAAWNGMVVLTGGAEKSSPPATGTVSMTAKISSANKQELKAWGDGESPAATIQIHQHDVVNSMAAEWSVENVAAEPVDFCPAGIERTFFAKVPKGVTTETEYARGELYVTRPEGSTGACAYALSASPANVVSLPSTIVIPAGKSMASAMFDAVQVGTVTITSTLLDGAGQPTSVTESSDLETYSLSALQTPQIQVSLQQSNLSFEPDGAYEGRAGQGFGALRVDRGGFSGFGTTSTQLSLQLTDPSGVVVGLPSTITIPAGQATATAVFSLGTATGSAQVDVLLGSETVGTLTLRSVNPTLAFAHTSLFLPQNGFCDLPLSLNHANCSSAETYVVGTSQSGVLTFESMDPTGFTFRTGIPTTALRIFADASQGSVQLSATVGTSLSASCNVTMRPTEVSISRSLVSLLNVGGTSAGSVILCLPSGATWQACSAPQCPGLSVVGVGTSTLVLEFAAGSRPSTLQFPVTLAGVDPVDPFVVTVQDSLRTYCPMVSYSVAVQ